MLERRAARVSAEVGLSRTSSGRTSRSGKSALMRATAASRIRACSSATRCGLGCSAVVPCTCDPPMSQEWMTRSGTSADDAAAAAKRRASSDEASSSSPTTTGSSAAAHPAGTSTVGAPDRSAARSGIHPPRTDRIRDPVWIPRTCRPAPRAAFVRVAGIVPSRRETSTGESGARARHRRTAASRIRSASTRSARNMFVTRTRSTSNRSPRVLSAAHSRAASDAGLPSNPSTIRSMV